ncbi:MAG: TIGR02452 family protein [Luteolibacter sp.]
MTCSFTLLPCLDSQAMADHSRSALDISPQRAAELGRSAMSATDNGSFLTAEGLRVDWAGLVRRAVEGVVSIAPGAPLPSTGRINDRETTVQISNEGTLASALRLRNAGKRPLALNFANGVSPGGGFLQGALAQEECLCRSSALYRTLAGDRMYSFHRERPLPDSSPWAILSPRVPVFRQEDGTTLDAPWLLDFISCAAPYAPKLDGNEAAELLRIRIHRVLAIAQAWGYETLVLGAWGCGAFGNDPARAAADFRSALGNEFRNVFSDVVFAIADWSQNRRYLGPFRDAFSKL